MRSYGLLLLGLFIKGTCALAAPVENRYPLVVVGGSSFCAMTDGEADPLQPLVKCWDRAGKPLTVPFLKHPLGLTMTVNDDAYDGDYVCASDGGKVLCWGNQPDKYQYHFAQRLTSAFYELTDAESLAAGSWLDVCALDGRGKLTCHAPWEKNPMPVVRTGIRQAAVGAISTCTLSDEGKMGCFKLGHTETIPDLVNAITKCEQTFSQTGVLGSAPLSRIAFSQSIRGCRVCGLTDRNEIHCSGRTPPPQVFVEPQQLIFWGYRPCVLEGTGRVVCEDWKDGRLTQPSPLQKPLPSPLALGSMNANYCEMDDDRVRCQFLNLAQSPPGVVESWQNPPVAEVTVEHGLPVRLFQLDRLPASLTKIGRYAPPAKRKLFQSAAEAFSAIAGSLPESEKKRAALFVLNAVAPLVAAIDSEYFEKVIGPRFRLALARDNAENSIHSLGAYRREGAPLAIALRLLRSPLQDLQQSPPTGTTRDVFADLLLATGEAMADPQSHAVLDRLQAAYSPVRAALREVPLRSRQGADAAILVEILDWLAASR